MNAPENITPPEEKKPDHKVTSKGEKWFDRITYGGIAGVATFILSLPVGYFVRYMPKGQAAVSWFARNLKKIGLGEEIARDAAMTTALMQGGNITVVPVKWLEDRKPELVAKLNERLNDESGAASVKDEPKQTWGSLIKARILLAWTPVFVSLRGTSWLLGKNAEGKGRFDVFEEKFAEHVVCKPLGQSTTYEVMEEGKKVIKETTAYKYGKIAAIDLFATAAAAFLLYVGSKFFARKNKEHWNGKDAKDSVPAAQPQSEPVSESPENRYTNTITPSSREPTSKRTESYAKAIAGQKASETSVELGA